MKTKYYTDCYLIEDPVRIHKLMDLFNISVKNDINKWVQSLSTRKWGKDTADLIFYGSPNYGNIRFLCEYAFAFDGRLIYGICYINDKGNSNGQELQIFADWNSYSLPPKKIRNSIDELRTKIFDETIQKLENSLHEKNERKEKLEQLNIEAYKNIIEDSYNDFIKNPNEAFARMIARTAYGFNKNHNLPYSEWLDKFEEYSIVVKEIKKLDNYEKT